MQVEGEHFILLIPLGSQSEAHDPGFFNLILMYRTSFWMKWYKGELTHILGAVIEAEVVFLGAYGYLLVILVHMVEGYHYEYFPHQLLCF